MTSRILLTVYLLIASGIVAIVAAGYYWYDQRSRPVAETLPTASPRVASEESDPSPLLAQAPAAPFTSVSPVSEARVWGTQTVNPTPKPKAATPTPTPRATSSPQTEHTAIEFISVPSSVTGGESFVIEWRVVGPAGTKGDEARISTSYHTSSQSAGSSATTNSDTKNSFGSFTVPKTFSSTYSFGGASGTIKVAATAVVEGREVRAERSIALR